MVSAISNSFGKEKLKYDDVRDLISSESIRMRESGESLGGPYSCESRGRKNQQRRYASYQRSKSRGHGKPNWGSSCGGLGIIVMKDI